MNNSTSLFERLLIPRLMHVEGHAFKANFAYSKSRDLANIVEAINKH